MISLSDSAQASEAQGILAPAIDDTELEQAVKTLREKGEIVIRQLVPLSDVSAEAQGCNRVLEQQSGEWHVVTAGK